jgi:hypothetical protein
MISKSLESMNNRPPMAIRHMGSTSPDMINSVDANWRNANAYDNAVRAKENSCELDFIPRK